MLGRQIRSKIVSVIKPAEGKLHEDAKRNDRQSRAKRKHERDRKRRATMRTIVPGDKILIKQQKTTTNPPFHPKPYTVTSVKGTQVTAERGSKKRIRNMAKCKLVHTRPEQLVRKRQVEDAESDSDDADDYINLKPVDASQQTMHASIEDDAEEQPKLWRCVSKKPDRYDPGDWRMKSQ